MREKEHFGLTGKEGQKYNPQSYFTYLLEFRLIDPAVEAGP
jgi:hypothetical protein